MGTYSAGATEGQLVGITPDAPGGRVVRRGAQVAFITGDLRDEDGNLLATATATAAIRRSD